MFKDSLASSKESVPLARSKTLAVPWYCSAMCLGQQSLTMLFLRKSLSDWSPRKTCHDVGHGVRHMLVCVLV